MKKKQQHMTMRWFNDLGVSGSYNAYVSSVWPPLSLPQPPKCTEYLPYVKYCALVLIMPYLLLLAKIGEAGTVIISILLRLRKI